MLENISANNDKINSVAVCQTSLPLAVSNEEELPPHPRDSTSQSLNAASVPPPPPPPRTTFAHRRCLSILAYITIEPIVFGVAFAFMLSDGVYSRTLFMNKLCLQYCGYSTQQCQNYGTGRNAFDIDISIQKAWTQFDTYDTLISTIPSVILTILLGSWSDKFGRKAILLMPSIGMMLSGGCMFILYYVTSLPYWTVFMPSLVQTASGGFPAVMTGSFAYIADQESKRQRQQQIKQNASIVVGEGSHLSEHADSRALRIAFVDMSMTCGIGAGGLVSGILVQNGAKPVVCYACTIAIAFVVAVYVIVRIRETRPPTNSSHSTIQMKLVSVLNIRFLLETWRAMQKSRPDHKRTNLWLLILAMFVFKGIFASEDAMAQTYLTGAPLDWSLTLYLQFYSAMTLINMVAIGIFIFVAKNIFKWRDCTIGIIACLSKIIHGYLFGVARTTWLVYVAFAFGVVEFVVVVAIRSLLSKTVKEHEQGKVFSILSMFDTLSQPAGSALVTAVFTTTAQWWPGFFSVADAYVMLLPLICIVIIDLNIMRSERRRSNERLSVGH